MTTQSLLFDYDRLTDLAKQSSGFYTSALPFPHIVLDDFLPEAVADRLWRNFPKVDDIRWKNKTGPNSKKLACNDLTQLGDFIPAFLRELNAHPFLGILESLTGIPDLRGDPEYEGGGIHQIQRGGFLNVHADFNFHPRLRMDRRLNLLVYLNKDWREDYGGHLELWDRTMTRCVKKVLPVFNRCVVFSTTDISFHGHPEKLTCPEDQTRKSIAVYYYTQGRPTEEKTDPHDTLYQRRPG